MSCHPKRNHLSDDDSSQKESSDDHSQSSNDDAPNIPMPKKLRASSKRVPIGTFAEDWRNMNPPAMIEVTGPNWFNRLRLITRKQSIGRRLNESKRELKPLREQHLKSFNRTLSSYFEVIIDRSDDCIIEDAQSVCVTSIDSIEFQDMCQIKNNKIVFIKSFENSQKFKETIAQNLTQVFKMSIEDARATLTGPLIQAFVFCHYTSNAHYVYASVIFEVCPRTENNNNHTWIVKWIYTKEHFRGLDFGKRLLQLVLKYQFIQHNVNKLILAVDTTETNPAQAWYESLGFENDLEWGSCTGHVIDYVKRERFDSESSKLIPYQFPAGETESGEECFFKTFQHDVYASILVYESRIQRGFAHAARGQNTIVPKLRLSKIFVTVLNKILQIDASRWPTPNVTQMNHRRAIEEFKDASRSNKETLEYIAEQTAIKQALCQQNENNLKQPSSFVNNNEEMPSFRGRN